MSNVKYELKPNPTTTLDVVLTSTDDAGNTTNIVIPMRLISEINTEIDKAVYYREDVLKMMETYIMNKKFPESARNDEKLISSIVDSYAHYRQDAEGDDCGMTWDECLVAAFVDHIAIKR